MEEPHSIENHLNPELLKKEIRTAADRTASTKTKNLEDRIRRSCINVLFLILTCHAVFGEIKNGYGNIRATKESLRILRALLFEDVNINPAKRRKIQETIENFENHISYYDLTENLLTQFKSIAPELYAQVDTITDRLGRHVNVHVQFVTAGSTEIQAEGTTYVNQVPNDIDACQSEYGEFTLAVKVWIVPRALQVLAHELGHVRYIVPNFANYLKYFKNHYYDISSSNCVGHNPDDPSGHTATQFAKSYQKNYSKFLKNSIRRLQDPPTLLARIRKESKII